MSAHGINDPVLSALPLEEQQAAERALKRMERTVDRTGWPEGPWDNELDYFEFDHFIPTAGRPYGVAVGYRCCCKRSRLGAWCGYVRVDVGHPLYGKSNRYSDNRDDRFDEFDVHGGVTHAEMESELKEEFWIGFDCAHGGDLSPGMHAARAKYSPAIPIMPGDVYRDAGYAEVETRKLAEQLLRMRYP